MYTATCVTYVLDSITNKYIPLYKNFSTYKSDKIVKFNFNSVGALIKFNVPDNGRKRMIELKLSDLYFIEIISSYKFDTKTINSIIEDLPEHFNRSGLKLFLSLNPEDLKKIPFTIKDANLIAGVINKITDQKAFIFDKVGKRVVSENNHPEPKENVESESNFFYFEKEVNQSLFLAKNHLDYTGYSNFLIVGTSGYGKTSIAKHVADKLNMKFVKVDMSLITEPQEFFGSMALVNGSTEFIETPFAKAIKEGNHVVLLDEINRAYPNIMNPLLALLDDTRSATYNGVTYNVAPNTMFIITANIGNKFTGTFQADAALMNRMNYVASVGNIPSHVESNIYVSRTGISKETAESIVKLLTEMRLTLSESNIDFSPRLGIAICFACQFGFSIRSAVLSCLNFVGVQEKRHIIDILGKHRHIDVAEMNLF